MADRSLMYFAAGLCAAAATYRTLSHILDQSRYELDFVARFRPANSRRNAWYAGRPSLSDDGLAADEILSSASLVQSLGSLALKSEWAALRESAAEVLLDLATRGEILPLVVKQARRGHNDARVRATVLVQVLAQTPGRAKKLARAGILPVLAAGMRQTECKELAVRSAATLADMLGGDSGRAMRRLAARSGVLDAVAAVLERAAAAAAERQRSDAVVVAVGVMLSRVYALHTEYHQQMVTLGLLPALLGVARQAGADVELLRACMESIVRLCTYLSAGHGADAEQHMSALVRLGAADVVGACVRHDDQGVASWGIGLLHEFASRGAGKQQLAARPALVRALCRRLSTARYAYTNQLILRSLWCLCTASRTALLALAAPHSLRRVLAVFSAAEDADAHYWAVALASRLASLPATHRWILRSPLPRCLPALVSAPSSASLRSMLVPEIATLLSRLAHCPATADAMATCPDIAHAWLLILDGDNDTARLTLVMAVIRAAATSRALLQTIDGDSLRARLAALATDFSLRHTQLYASKALATMVCARVDPPTAVPDAALLFFNALDCAVITTVARLLGAAPTMVLPPAPAGWLPASYPQHVAAAVAFSSAFRVCVAEQTRRLGHFLFDPRVADYLDALADFHMGMLAHLALCTAHALDMADDVRDTMETISSQPEYLMRLGINVFVERYYATDHDPHGLAAAADRAHLASHALGLRDDDDDAQAFVPWSRSDSHVRGLLLARPQEGSQNPIDAKYPGLYSHRTRRLRDLLPIIEPSLSALAESLTEAGAELQTPSVAARTLWIARILYHELPADARGLVMRVVAAIAPAKLSRSDAAGLTALCRAHLLADNTPEYDAEKYPDRPLSDAAYACWQQLPGSTMGPRTEISRSAIEYFMDHPTLTPETLQTSGLFYARLALDRFVARWFTSLETYACAGTPLLSSSSSSSVVVASAVASGERALWTADRSGPPGADDAADCKPTVFYECASTGSAGFDQDGDDACCVRARPPSPFPVGDSSSSCIYPTVTLRARPLAAVSSPGTAYHVYAPFYPSFSVLGDGCTIWNAGWKFSSVRMCSGFDSRLGGIHRYQVQLLSSGLMQVGWCTESCVFLPESGEGVGDDEWSLAYDGFRRRKWHGLGDINHYGERWQAGDIITAELDFDHDQVTFYRNGSSMGVAFARDDDRNNNDQDTATVSESINIFRGLGNGRIWYPAFSFSSDQGLVFLGAGGGEQNHQPRYVFQRDSDPSESKECSPSSESDLLVSERDVSIKQCSDIWDPAAMHVVEKLQATGAVTAGSSLIAMFGLRFDFQDLDAVPCIGLKLPGAHGELIIGPVPGNGNLATYLQPRWCVVHARGSSQINSDDFCSLSSTRLSRRFVNLVSSASFVDDGNVQVLTSRLVPYATSVVFAVFDNGQVAVIAMHDGCPESSYEDTLVFDILLPDDNKTEWAKSQKSHVWLPTVSSAVLRFSLNVAV
ncbi:hypothetical protein FB645_001770 [Coemansia sp. IMI 203386]|nr:hypothetical protein FB645_001770 [Coemansia sp. IMI 203386]